MGPMRFSGVRSELRRWKGKRQQLDSGWAMAPALPPWMGLGSRGERRVVGPMRHCVGERRVGYEEKYLTKSMLVLHSLKS